MCIERKEKVRMPLPSASFSSEVGTIQNTTGTPTWTPTPDQLPLAYDQTSNTLYFYNNSWRSFGLTSLNELNLNNVSNLDNVVRVPITYDSGTNKVEGYITLREFKALVNER